MSKQSRILANQRALDLVASGLFDREEVARLYTGLGGTIENSRGLAGLHERRQQDHAQFFTPAWVGKLISDMLAIHAPAQVFDNSCGSGNMFWSLEDGVHAVGIDFEENAHKIAKAIYPQHCIIKDSMINHIEDVTDKFNYYIGNPPFSITLENPRAPLHNAGYGGRILSQICSIEIAFKSVIHNGYVAMVLPSNTFEREDTRMLSRWISSAGVKVAEIKLPEKDVFPDTDWPCSIFIWQRFRRLPYELMMGRTIGESSAFKAFIPKFNEDTIREVLHDWKGSPHYSGYLEFRERSSVMDYARFIHENPPSERVIIAAVFEPEGTEDGEIVTGDRLPITDLDIVTIKKGDKYLSLKPNGLVAAIKIAEARATAPTKNDWASKSVYSEWNSSMKLQSIYTTGGDADNLKIANALKSAGVEVEIDDQLRNWLKKKHRWWLRQSAHVEQYIQRTQAMVDDDTWEIIPAEGLGLRTEFADIYRERQVNLERLKFYYPFLESLWPSQVDDILRASMKQSSIMAKQQGLGKTRSGYAWAVLTQCSRCLFVVPSHLLGEWEEEADELDLKINVIESVDDLKRLKHLNVISYDTLSVPLTDYDAAKAKIARKVKKTKGEFKYPRHRTIADYLAKRIGAVVFDEMHLLSNKLTLRSQAGNKLRPKYKLALTGTPINNHVTNLWSIMDILYGAGHQGVPGHPAFPYNTKEFIDRFQTTEWVSREFAETGSTGRTAQKRAIINNVGDFQEIMAPKMIRRVKLEPEIKADIIMPEYELIEHPVTPSIQHLAHYKLHLIEFKNWLEEALSEQEQGHAMNTASLLAQISNLMFASTVPQHPKVNISQAPWQGGLAEKQKKFIDLVKFEIAHGNRVFVASQRPDFASMAMRWLAEEGIKAVEFTGRVDRRERFELKRRVRYDESIEVMLGSYGVAATGLNLWFLQSAILVDFDWRWSVIEQLFSRLLRPQQRAKCPRVHLIYNEGMIDMYMRQHCQDKRAASSEGIDHRDDIQHIEKWESFLDISVRMLKDAGLM